MAQQQQQQGKIVIPYVAPFLQSVWYINAQDVLGQKRSASVDAMSQVMGPLVKGANAGKINRADAGTVAQVASIVHNDREAGKHVCLDPSKFPEENEPEHIKVFKTAIANMHVRAVSNALNHREALLGVAASAIGAGDESWSLVLEDDALFTQEAPKMLDAIVTSCPKDADVIMLGLPSTKNPKDGEIIFEKAYEKFIAFPACESYLIRSKAAKLAAETFLPVRFNANVQLSYVFRKLDLQVYTCVPNVFVDGSKLGVFCSTLEVNNRLLWNQPWCQLESLLRGDAFTADPEKASQIGEELWKNQPFQGHPDAMALKAELLSKQGKHTDAEAVYSKTYDEYLKNDCMLNNISAFLRRYAGVYGNLQGDIPEPIEAPADAVDLVTPQK